MRWEGGDSEDRWELEIEHDVFEENGPVVVSVWVANPDKEALAVLSPAEARGAAKALRHYAHECERQEARTRTP